MSNTSSFEQISKTSNLDSNLILRQYRLDSVAIFMEIKSANPRLRQDLITKESVCSISTLQRYRHDINMLSPFRILSNNHKRWQNISNTIIGDNSNREHDLKRPRMALKWLQNNLLQISEENWKVVWCIRLMKLTVNN